MPYQQHLVSISWGKLRTRIFMSGQQYKRPTTSRPIYGSKKMRAVWPTTLMAADSGGNIETK